MIWAGIRAPGGLSTPGDAAMHSVTLQVAGAKSGQEGICRTQNCEFRSTEKANAKSLAGAQAVFCQCKSIK